MLLCFRAVGARSARRKKKKKFVLNFEFEILNFCRSSGCGQRSVLGRLNPLLDIFDVDLNVFNVTVFSIAEVV